jgi:hypothetical protein
LSGRRAGRSRRPRCGQRQTQRARLSPVPVCRRDCHRYGGEVARCVEHESLRCMGSTGRP